MSGRDVLHCDKARWNWDRLHAFPGLMAPAPPQHRTGRPDTTHLVDDARLFVAADQLRVDSTTKSASAASPWGEECKEPLPVVGQPLFRRCPVGSVDDRNPVFRMKGARSASRLER